LGVWDKSVLIRLILLGGVSAIWLFLL